MANFDLSLDTIFKALEILAILGGGLALLLGLRSWATAIKLSLTVQEEDIRELKENVKTITKVLIDQARIEAVLTNLATVINGTGKRVDDLTVVVNKILLGQRDP